MYSVDTSMYSASAILPMALVVAEVILAEVQKSSHFGATERGDGLCRSPQSVSRGGARPSGGRGVQRRSARRRGLLAFSFSSLPRVSRFPGMASQDGSSGKRGHDEPETAGVGIETPSSLKLAVLRSCSRRRSELLLSLGAATRDSPPQSFLFRIPREKTMHLNETQFMSLSSFSHNVELVQGPPGTGKSTLIESMLQEASDATLADKAHKPAFCVTAVQNRAVEAIAIKLRKSNIPFVAEGARLRSILETLFTANA